MNMYLFINDIMTELSVISTKLKSQRRLANYFQKKTNIYYKYIQINL